MHVVPNIQNIETKAFVSSVSPKGQITLPKELRDVLGVTPKAKVSLRLAHGAVTVVPITATLESIYQSVPALRRPVADRDMSAIVHEEHAQEVAHKGR
jgi:bifunctional DNA-binding transcriptional regulator/antitoxin component of YhaV-PrlF toxin-antitoxin module